MENTIDFKPELFECLRLRKNEDIFLDYKERLYRCDSDKEKFEFAKDLIAFANTSRRTGKEAYILFGIRDESKELVDIRDQFVGRKKPKNWDNECIDWITKHHEGVGRRLQDIARDWIYPFPFFHYLCGWIDGKFVGYIFVEPSYPKKPFHLKKDYNYVKEGKVFIRCGSSSVPVDDEVIDYIACHNNAAYLGRGDWQDIIQYHSTGEYLKFWELYPYLELSCKNHEGQESAFETIKKLIENGERRIIIRAGMGKGKTTLTYRLAYYYASLHNLENVTDKQFYGDSQIQNIVKNPERELEVVPPILVPLRFDLRFSFTSKNELIDALTLQLKQMLDSKSRKIEIDRIFNISGSRWIVFLDGVDEIRNIQSAGPFLDEWIKELPSNVSVVVTSRPESFQDVEGFSVIELNPPTKEDILFFITKHIETKEYNLRSPDIIKNIKKGLEENEEVYPFLRNMRALQAFVEEFLPDVVLPTAPIDIEKVEIASTNEEGADSVVLPSNINQVIPKVGSNEYLSDADFFTEPKNKQESNENNEEVTEDWRFPQTAILIRVIVDFIIEKEKKRQEDMGGKSRHIVKEARAALQKTAWFSEWGNCYLNFNECLRKRWLTKGSFYWSLNADFIQLIPGHENWFEYYCSLLRYFFAAEYVYEHNPSENSLRRKIHSLREGKKNLNAGKSVFTLLNQLRQANGLERLIFVEMEEPQ